MAQVQAQTATVTLTANLTNTAVLIHSQLDNPNVSQVIVVQGAAGITSASDLKLTILLC